MVKVLIADDERLAVKYYTQLINWSFYGFEIVGTAYDGKEALHILETKEPDIIITDIKMPVMDGIEFAKKAREINHNIHILFVTSYTDFNYTYGALKLGADDYMMKDLINGDVLVQKLLEIERKISAAKNENSYKTERVVEEIFTCGRIEENKLEWLGEQAQKILEGRFFYLYMKRDGLIPSAAAQFSNENEKPEEKRIAIEVCRKYMDPNYHPISIFRFRDGILSIVRQSGRTESSLQDYAEQLQSRLETALHASVSIFCLSEPQTLAAAGALFANAESRTFSRIFLGRKLILDMQAAQLDSGTVDEAFELHLVESCIKSNDMIRLTDYLSDFFEKVIRAKDAQAFDFAFYNCLNCFQKYGRDLHGLHAGKAFSTGLREHDKSRMYTVPDAVDWLMEKFELLLSIRSDGRTEQYSRDTFEIIKYIMNHYGNPDLDVDGISKGVAMSMTRSETKFKQETGLTLIDYLNKYRIQKAMELLENGDVKIYEISEKVGFASSQYFSKVFKKYTAQTPIEYRKRLADEIYEKHRN